MSLQYKNKAEHKRFLTANAQPLLYFHGLIVNDSFFNLTH